MNEKHLINIIKNITNSKYIGDDCAYLSNLGIVVTQDSLVEGVHFSLDYTDAYKLGWKSATVNISDVCASGAEPLYMTVGLSLPKYLNDEFVKEFYKGLKDASGNMKIVGGDLTAADKLYISITAIGSDNGRRISSRSNAKAGYKVIVSGEHGNSAYGFKLLQEGLSNDIGNKFVKAHLMPEARKEFSKEIATNIEVDYAMTDTSDGLADALMQVAKSSNVVLDIDTSKIPYDLQVDIDTVLYGGEDYELVACVPEKILKYVKNYTIIGEVKEGKAGIIFDGEFMDNIDSKIFNHFR